MRLTPTGIRAAAVLLAGIALVLGLEHIAGRECVQVVLVATLGPIAGFIAERRSGGTGIIGAVMGGIVFPMTVGIFLYLQGNANAGTGTGDYAGPGLALLSLGFQGAIVGLAVGVLGWGTLRLTGFSGSQDAARQDKGVAVSDLGDRQGGARG